jgi:hypothetical protein
MNQEREVQMIQGHRFQGFISSLLHIPDIYQQRPFRGGGIIRPRRREWRFPTDLHIFVHRLGFLYLHFDLAPKSLEFLTFFGIYPHTVLDFLGFPHIFSVSSRKYCHFRKERCSYKIVSLVCHPAKLASSNEKCIYPFLYVIFNMYVKYIKLRIYYMFSTFSRWHMHFLCNARLILLTCNVINRY